jgi:hypothetical protein
VHPLKFIYFLVHPVWCHQVQIPPKSKAQNATSRALKKINENKIKFGNTKLGLPSLNDTKSKECTHFFIHSFSSHKNPFSKWFILLCIHPLPDNN